MVQVQFSPTQSVRSNVPGAALAFLCATVVASFAVAATLGSAAAQQAKPEAKPALPAHAQSIPHEPPLSPAAASTTPAMKPSDTGWAPADSQIEHARCNHLLRALDITTKPVTPMRDQDCGAAAPVELSAIGKSPQVVLNPPVIVTCDMAAALHRWVTKELQPLARKQMGASLVRIDTMSSYSCRNAYGRRNAKLSEHGRANAIDIRSFTASNGTTAEVLADWGPTAHDIAAQVAAAKKQEAVRAAAAKNAPAAATGLRPSTVPGAPAVSAIATGSNQQTGTQPAAPGLADLTRPTISIGTRNTAGGVPAPLPGPGVLGQDTGIGIFGGIGGQPLRLGGPKVVDAPLTNPGKMDFLRGAHAAACRVFATTLGPEANAAHRNHFHVDLADRKSKAICE